MSKVKPTQVLAQQNFLVELLYTLYFPDFVKPYYMISGLFQVCRSLSPACVSAVSKQVSKYLPSCEAAIRLAFNCWQSIHENFEATDNSGNSLAAALQLAFIGCAIIGAVVLYKVFQGSSVEGAIRETKGTLKGGYKDAKGQVKVRLYVCSAIPAIMRCNKPELLLFRYRVLTMRSREPRLIADDFASLAKYPEQ